MAKTEKKKNRKLRRRMRKTSAIVLMITAIIVAAIPVPENTAAPAGGARSEEQKECRRVDAYAYDVKAATSDVDLGDYFSAAELFGTINLDRSKVRPEDIYKGYNLFTFSGDSEPTLQYQYELYESGNMIVICGYNNAYIQGNITIANRMYRDYEVVTESDIEDFRSQRRDNFTMTFSDPDTIEDVGKSTHVDGKYTYTNSGNLPKYYKKRGDSVSMTATTIADPIWKWLAQNLPTFQSEYEQYKTRYDAYVSEQGSPLGWSEKLTLDFNSLTQDEAYRYYCETSYSSLSGVGALSGCSLVRVVDERGEGNSGYVWVPQVVEEGNGVCQAGSTIRVDDNVTSGVKIGGYVCGHPTSKTIGGIANGVFKGVHNIQSLTLPGNLAYIGNSAFEDSFITSVTAPAVVSIGNAAFKNCIALQSFTANADPSTLTHIGAEAFMGSALTNFVMPNSVMEIGPGAFANCSSLASVSVASGQNTPCELCKFAFYNCPALTSVDWGEATTSITKIGKAAFAISSGADQMTEFTFPEGPADKSLKLEDYILAGRGSLQTVHMPVISWGYGTIEKIPQHTFVNCYNLGYLDFTADNTAPSPYSGGRIEYDGNGENGGCKNGCKLFEEVTNPDLYVRGPKVNSSGRDVASPRSSTWDAQSAVSVTVPYVYNENGKDYYEVSDGYYLLSIDSDGILQSCQFRTGMEERDKTEFKDGDNQGEVVIPSKVGNIMTKGIASGAFDQDDIKDYIRSIVIEDDSQIKSIGEGVFANCPYLENVVVGNTINEIGARAFENCGTGISASGEVHVTFHSPVDGHAAFTMGKDAFTTGGKPLVFFGDVISGYAPFDHAMDPATYAKEDTGLRILYESLRPQDMEVVGNRFPNPPNLMVIQDNETNLPTLVDYPQYEDINTQNADYIEQMVAYNKQAYAGPEYDDERLLYAIAVEDNDEAGKAIHDGPWNDGQTVSGDGLDAPSAKVGDYYERHPYDLLELYESASENRWEQLAPQGIAIVNSTLDIIIPQGVKSIDAYDYYTKQANNGVNYTTYKDLIKAKSKYIDEGDGTEEVTPGLFSGWFDEKEDRTQCAETAGNVKGNDYITSVAMYDVEYLPEYAFDNCQNLMTVTLGAGMEDIGVAPFRGCDNLTEVEGNDKYIGENGIIYSKNEDGSYTIEECLPARGRLDPISGTTVSPDFDPLLMDVSRIQEGAFEECNNIRQVYLDTLTKLTAIPKRAFRNCRNLRVTLPETVKLIQEEAFATPGNAESTTEVTIYGREVAIASDAFDHDKDVMIRSYEDSAAIEWAKYYDTSWEIIGETHYVTFLDYDGTLLGVESVEDGKDAAPPENPTRDGYRFTGWSGSYQQVYEDRVLIAQYEADQSGNTPGSGTDNPGGSGSDNPSGSGSGTGTGTGGDNNNSSSNDDDDDDDDIHTVTVVNGMGSGRYKKGRTVTITANPAPEGQSFAYWTTGSENVALANADNSTTTFTMPDNSVVVTANYKEGSSGSSTTYSTTAPTVTSTPTGTGNNGGGSGGSGSGAGDGTGGSGSTGGAGDGTAESTGTNADIIISKPGISNTNVASASVEGSTDHFVVRVTDSGEAEEAVRNALTAEYGSLDNIVYTSMDISLYDSTGTVPISDATGLKVNITMPIPDAQVGYGGNNKAAGVVDGALDKLDARYNTINGVDCITFTATHFSPYTVYVDTANLSAASDISPQTGDPIHPKWFLAFGLACLSILLFMKRDEKRPKAA